jgi:hypothetical protein
MKPKATVPADFAVGQMGSTSFNSRSRRVKKLFPEAVALCAIIMVISYGFAQTWRQTSGPNFFPFSIAASADGKIIMAVGSGSTPPVVSTNSGATWTTNTTFPSWSFGIASSVDGTKVVGEFHIQTKGNVVFVSTNSGSTWTQTSLPQGLWWTFASSADGIKLTAAANNGLIYTSTNSGTTWLTNNMPANTWESIASSADGTKLAVVAYNDKIYTSTNSGLTWRPTSAPNSSWYSIASSADGNRFVATGDGGSYISTNSGSSWTRYGIVGHGVASSADGGRLIIVGEDIYTSTNFGISWASTNISGKTWYSAASSADGGELLAGENGTGVWICQVTPSPRLKITPSFNNLALSWLVPSTNFVLQQSADLASWADVTNLPVLNLTNLQNEVMLSPSSSRGFYRLKTP